MRVNGHLVVGRLGARSDADLTWETELLQHLDREGLTVPVPIPTTARMTSLRKRQPHGKPPSAGTTSTQSSDLPKFERSELTAYARRGRFPRQQAARANGMRRFSADAGRYEFLCAIRMRGRSQFD